MRRLLILLTSLVCVFLVASLFATTALAQSSCPTTRLAVGGQGQVTPGTANRIRDTASTSGTLLGQIPPGDIFDVLEGPQCNDGFL